MNRSLTCKITKEEVRESIFSIKAESAPGSDGMTGVSLQKIWHIIGESVTSEIQEGFVKGCLRVDWNFTYMCLLPKIPNPENMTELRLHDSALICKILRYPLESWF